MPEAIPPKPPAPSPPTPPAAPPSKPSSVRRLLPPGPPATIEQIVRDLSFADRAGAERPHLLLNMVSTLDGRATLDGRSGPIGNRADRELFHGLRTAVDAVLVGAGTARAEHYRRLIRDVSGRALRRGRGLVEEPLACIVSGRLALSGEDIPLLNDPAAHVAILTASNESLPRLGAQIEYVRAERDGRLDLAGALAQLHERFGVRTLLGEGGPHLNAQLLAAGLVDELFLSLAPLLAGGGEGGEALRILAGAELSPPVHAELLGVLESESHLFLRYGLRGPSPAKPSP
jgi:riboflavin biosynthesis pyrimidine reductase